MQYLKAKKDNWTKGRQARVRALRAAGLIHSDIKPENLLLSKDSESIKLSDFGCALLTSEATKVKTDIMQPRYYRAPEIILGQAFDTQIDIWSAGCTLFQIATDHILFEGESNNLMVQEMLKVCGPFSRDVATAGRYCLRHFDATGDSFMLTGCRDGNEPELSKAQKIKNASFNPPQRSLQGLLEAFITEPTKDVEETRHEFIVRHLSDLLRSCLEPDQKIRFTPEAALKHRFFQKSAGDALADLCWLYQ